MSHSVHASHAVARQDAIVVVTRASASQGDADEKPSSRESGRSKNFSVSPLHIPRGLSKAIAIWGGLGAGIGSGFLRPGNAEVRPPYFIFFFPFFRLLHRE